jgi:ATP-dependent Zn protease
LVVSAAEIVKGKYAGVGVERVKKLFDKARFEANASKGKLAMVFIDELDSCGRSRGADESSASADRDQTLNQILVELDGFKTESTSRVIVLAATNRPSLLDAALLRKGRFDVIVPMRVPGAPERAALFKYYISKQRTAAACDEVEFNVNTVDQPPSFGAKARRPAVRVVARVVDKGNGSSNGTAVDGAGVATWRLLVLAPQCAGAASTTRRPM